MAIADLANALPLLSAAPKTLSLTGAGDIVGVLPPVHWSSAGQRTISDFFDRARLRLLNEEVIPSAFGGLHPKARSPSAQTVLIAQIIAVGAPPKPEKLGRKGDSNSDCRK